MRRRPRSPGRTRAATGHQRASRPVSPPATPPSGSSLGKRLRVGACRADLRRGPLSPRTRPIGPPTMKPPGQAPRVAADDAHGLEWPVTCCAPVRAMAMSEPATFPGCPNLPRAHANQLVADRQLADLCHSAPSQQGHRDGHSCVGEPSGPLSNNLAIRVAFSADASVETWATIDNVSPGVTRKYVISIAAINEIITVAAYDYSILAVVRIFMARLPKEGIAAVATVNAVTTRTTRHRVISDFGEDDVIATVTTTEVAAPVHIQHIGSIEAGHRVNPVGAVKGVGGVRPDNRGGASLAGRCYRRAG